MRIKTIIFTQMLFLFLSCQSSPSAKGSDEPVERIIYFRLMENFSGHDIRLKKTDFKKSPTYLNRSDSPHLGCFSLSEWKETIYREAMFCDDWYFWELTLFQSSEGCSEGAGGPIATSSYGRSCPEGYYFMSGQSCGMTTRDHKNIEMDCSDSHFKPTQEFLEWETTVMAIVKKNEINLYRDKRVYPDPFFIRFREEFERGD